MHVSTTANSTKSFTKHDFIERSTTAGIQSIKQQTNIHDDKVVNNNDVKKVANKLNEFMEPLRTNLQFKYHEELNEYYVTVVNPVTNEVIKEIPPKKMLDMYAAMVGFMGILIDEKI